MNNPKKNYIYNIIYQILILIIPLIISPYLSRVVGAEGIGIFSYTYSIVYYFMLLTLLGVNNYGNRSIAKVRDNKKNLSKAFWSIYSFQLLMGILMLLSYLIYLFFFNVQYKQLFLIETIYIVSAMLDINWFFYGLEEFKKTITRNTILKVGTLLLVIIFVKKPTDLWKYALIMSLMTLLSQLVLWNFTRGKVDFVRVSFSDIAKHIKPNLVLFIPVIAVSIYKMMDKVMLGAMTNIKEVGFYENAEKIVNIPLTIISALGTVMLPRITNMVSNGKNEEVKKYINKSIEFVMFLSFAMCFGLITIGYDFAPLFFGKEFQKTGILIILLSVTLPFISFANVIRTQYLIPFEKDKLYTKSVIYGAIINLIMNAIFIPKYDSIGACFGTIAAEVFVMLYQLISIKREYNFSKVIKNILPFLLTSIIMIECIYPIKYFISNKIIVLALQVIVGVIIYGLFNLKYIDQLINLKRILKIKH